MRSAGGRGERGVKGRSWRRRVRSWGVGSRWRCCVGVSEARWEETRTNVAVVGRQGGSESGEELRWGRVAGSRGAWRWG